MMPSMLSLSISLIMLRVAKLKIMFILKVAKLNLMDLKDLKDLVAQSVEFRTTFRQRFNC